MDRKGSPMSYELFRESNVESFDPNVPATFEQMTERAAMRGHLQWLGTFPDMDTATEHRHDDVIQVLAENSGAWTMQRHLILGPGLRGERTEHWATCFVGPDPEIPQVSPTHQLVATLVDTRLWLEQLRAGSGPAEPAPSDRIVP